MIVNTNLTLWDLIQAIIPVANRQSLDMAQRCKELRNIHQIKSTIHCLGINLTNIRVLWDHIWLNSYRFLTPVVREMWSDRGDSMFYSLIGRSILMKWAFAPQLGVLIPQRDKWRSGHRVMMMTSWNGSAFRVTGPLWGESTGGFRSQKSSNAALKLSLMLS